MSDSCLEPDHNFDYFDKDDIDGFEFERLNNAIAEATDDLSNCDREHKAECKADLTKLQDELVDLKAGR
jgi:hypothetical protein|tara:strand:+ start:287 stop:493 length:207 start_codon:yes stop_codon:yes gene_type:complete